LFRKLLVDSAYYINTSTSYAKTKHFFYKLLEDPKSWYKKYFDTFMIMLIFMSVFILIREVKSHVNDELLFFNNYIISLIFFIEYMLRLWISSSVTQIIIDRDEHDTILGNKLNLFKVFKQVISVKLKYIFTLKAMVDLLAIVPFFHELRLLRLFILFRVFKLFRYTKSIQTFASVIAAKKFEFITLLIFASIVVFISSVLIYVMEANNPNSPIDTLFEAIYWAVVTISTVGYGDITPATVEGRSVAMFVIVAGIAVYSFTTSLVVTAFTEKLDEIKDIKIIDDVSKLKEFYIVCGYSAIAKEVVKTLVLNTKVIILDKNSQNVMRAKKDGFVALNYDHGSIASYDKLHINIKKQVKAILCLNEDDVENVYTALTVRSIDKDVLILSILKNQSNKNKLKIAGVNEIIDEKELVGMIARESVGKPIAFEAIDALRSNHGNIDIHELVINERILENYKEVSMIDAQKFRVILLGVYNTKEGKFHYDILENMTLSVGDFLLLIGDKKFMKEFELYLHKKVSR